jgi:hypothetical protein
MSELNHCEVCGGFNVKPSDSAHPESNLYCMDCKQYIIGSRQAKPQAMTEEKEEPK